jgi:predicted DNA-binding transcriptional regulator YafY
MKLTEVFKSLITEIASVDSVRKSIEDKQKIIMYYDGDEPGGRGLRLIEPVALGRSKRGNLVLRAWDEEGASHRGYLGTRPMPGWRLFKLDKILSYKPSGENFNTPRPNFNTTGDKDMTSIIIIAKF